MLEISKIEIIIKVFKFLLNLITLTHLKYP
jgi:hypothetical protein